MDTLVTTDWLSRHLSDPNIVVLDCTVRVVPTDGGGMKNVSGRTDYDSGHILSAGFADLTGDLCERNKLIEFAMPSPSDFCAAMGALGVGDDSQVVLYDSFLSAWAARVWWMLRWVGFDGASLLDGGLELWKAEGRPLSTESVTRSPGKLNPTPRPDLIADRDEVFRAISDDAVCLIDTMPQEHYRGEQAAYDRPGHIPSAVNVSGLALIDEAGRYRSHDELAAMYPNERDARTITYCGGGILASSSAFVMTRLGFTDVAVYTASLQEWAANPDNPMVVE